MAFRSTGLLVIDSFSTQIEAQNRHAWRHIQPSYIFCGVLLFSIPIFSVSVFPVLVLYVFALGALLFSAPAVFKSPKVDKKLFLFILFFLSPSIVAVFSLLPSSAINSHDLDYQQLNPAGRIFNLAFFSLITVMIHYQVTKHGLRRMMFWLWWGGLIFLVFGAWHAASIYGLFAAFPFDTRSHVHSAGGVAVLAGERVTGLAREPSFFVPFVVDFIVLTLLVISSKAKRAALLVLAGGLIVLSLSPSGFMILAGAILGGFGVVSARYVLSMKWSSRTSILSLVSLFFISALLYVLVGSTVWEYILNRFLTLGDSGRFYMMVMPFFWAFDSSMLGLLFGNGIKTYSIIGTQFFLPSGDAIHVTSNNVFTDIFWEAGLVGLLLLISFYGYCFSKILTSRFSSFQTFLAGVLLFDMFFSGLVRGDYASLRVFIMFYLLFVLMHYDIGKLWLVSWKR